MVNLVPQLYELLLLEVLVQTVGLDLGLASVLRYVAHRLRLCDPLEELPDSRSEFGDLLRKRLELVRMEILLELVRRHVVVIDVPVA